MMKHVLLCLAFFLKGVSVWSQQDRCNLPWVDLSEERSRQSVIAHGTPDLYNGHPTTVMLDDQKTLFCVWSNGHGGKAAYLAESRDAGLTWTPREIPSDWPTMKNCPSLYRLTDKKGRQRLFVFSAEPHMGYSYSEDNGKTWSKVQSLNKPCVMAFTSIVKLKNGDYMGFYHRGFQDQDRSPLTLWSAISHDGGLTWEESHKIAAVEGKSPCEPLVFRAPNGHQLVCIARENLRTGHSLMMFSEDEGKTWSPMRDTPWGLTGDRHMMQYLPDGRIVVVFRDMAPNSPTKCHFVAWVGTYNDLVNGSSGQYRIKLLHSFAGWDCGYPGLELLPDGSLLAITYIKYAPGKEKHSVVQVKFNLDETDALFKKQGAQ